MVDQPYPIPEPHYAIQNIHSPANPDHIKRKYLDVPYASQPHAQNLDIYLPEDIPGLFPATVSIHGGAFMGCDKPDALVLIQFSA